MEPRVAQFTGTMSNLTISHWSPSGSTEQQIKESLRHRAHHDKNIEQILKSKEVEWNSLYTHPKLMNMYYWKDDANNSRQQRTAELRKAMQTIAMAAGTTKRVPNNLLKPVLFNSNHLITSPNTYAVPTAAPPSRLTTAGVGAIAPTVPQTATQKVKSCTENSG